VKPNPYETLGLSANASQTEIVRAYRRLARQFHPDRQPPERKVWAEEQMKRLNEAYAILGDPQVRARYDAGLGLRTDPSSTPKRGTAYHPTGEWHQLFTWTKLAFWSLVIGFLFVGAYIDRVTLPPAIATVG